VAKLTGHLRLIKLPYFDIHTFLIILHLGGSIEVTIPVPTMCLVDACWSDGSLCYYSWNYLTVFFAPVYAFFVPVYLIVGAVHVYRCFADIPGAAAADVESCLEWKGALE